MPIVKKTSTFKNKRKNQKIICGYQIINVTVNTPLGITFSEDKEGNVFVEEVSEGGNADMSGKIKVGDYLSKCSAVVFKEGKINNKEGYGKRLYTDWERQTFIAENQDFDIVMKALQTNNSRWGYRDIQLEFKRFDS